jgi:hypothetical protein
LRDIGVNVVIQNFDQATLRSVFRTDPTAFDMVLTSVAGPTRTGLSTLLGNVRFSEIIGSPGAWDGLEQFMEIGAAAEGSDDLRERGNAMFEMLRLFNPAVPWFGVADLANATAYSVDLNEPVVWALGNIRYTDFTFK